MKQYIKPFDTVRFLAAFFVIIYHWFPDAGAIHQLNFGRIGVQVFFVLSGFLITTILLSDKEKSQAGASLGSFFLKRTFRIFPLYYFVLFSFSFLNDIKEHMWWFLLYAGNFLLASTYPDMPPLHHSVHFWTLAVEEQFYLIWPFLILLLPFKYIKPTIIGAVVLGLILKVVSYSISGMQMSTLMPLQMVSIGAGALFAYYNKYSPDRTEFLRKPWALGFSIFFVAFSLLVTVTWVNELVNDILTSMLAIIIIANTLTLRQGTTIYRLMTIRPILFLGTISYGLYVYHMFVPFFEGNLHLYATHNNVKIPFIDAYLFPKFDKGIMMLLYRMCILIGASMVSWYVLESPLNKLGHKLARKLKERQASKVAATNKVD